MLLLLERLADHLATISTRMGHHPDITINSVGLLANVAVHLFLLLLTKAKELQHLIQKHLTTIDKNRLKEFPNKSIIKRDVGRNKRR